MEVIFKQKVNATIEEAWDFFTDPNNLSLITPKEMNFKIISSSLSAKIYPGMIISYHVSPLLGLRMNWLTEITQVEDKKFFIDDQRVGPFRLWHHQHIFEEVPGGVMMTDIVNYRAPFGILGRVAERLIVNRKVRQIFEYREKVLNKVFK